MSKTFVPASVIDLIFKLNDVILEFEAYVNEYDEGLPICRDTHKVHEAINRMKAKLNKWYSDFSYDDSTESLD